MNVQAPVIRTVDDFLRWNEGREGKYEFVRGRIVDMMVRVTRSHVHLASRLTFALATRLDPERFLIGSADFGIRTPVGVRYPDVFVDGAEGEARDLAARAPLLVAEILSPSTMAVDFGPKAEEYTGIASLLHYLVLSPDEPRVWLWKRGEEGAFLSPEMIAGAEESVHLDGLGLVIPLAELYRGIA